MELFLYIVIISSGTLFFSRNVDCSAPANSSRAHYYIPFEKPEPTQTQTVVEVYTSTSTVVGWTTTITSENGWNTITPTQAGWPTSTTTDYSGWATATPSPPGWNAPTPAPAPPPHSGWATPAPNGWQAPTPPPTPGWSPAPPPPTPGWAPPPSTPGWSPPPPPPSGWSSPPAQLGWNAPPPCASPPPIKDCTSLENFILTNILHNSTYHKELRPPPYDYPTVVSVDVFIKNILYINDSDKMWKAQLTLRQQWNDPRLAYSTQGCSGYKQFTLTDTNLIWTPDLFFPLEEESSYHEVPQRNILLWIAPEGDVTFSTRITVIMNCRGKKTDTELKCPLIIGSYAYSSDKLRLQWLQPDPVQIDLERIDLPNYTVAKVATSGSGDPTTYLGQFPGVVAKFTFAKKVDQCSRYGW